MNKKFVAFFSIFLASFLILFTCIIAVASFALYSNIHKSQEEEYEARRRSLAIQLVDNMLVPSGYVLDKKAVPSKGDGTMTYVTKFTNGEKYIKIIQYPLNNPVDGTTPVECDPTDIIQDNGYSDTLTECRWLNHDIRYVFITNDNNLSEAKIRRMLDVKPVTEYER